MYLGKKGTTPEEWPHNMCIFCTFLFELKKIRTIRAIFRCIAIFG